MSSRPRTDVSEASLALSSRHNNFRQNRLTTSNSALAINTVRASTSVTGQHFKTNPPPPPQPQRHHSLMQVNDNTEEPASVCLSDHFIPPWLRCAAAVGSCLRQWQEVIRKSAGAARAIICVPAANKTSSTLCCRNQRRILTTARVQSHPFVPVLSF